MKKHLSTIILIFIFFVGLAVMLYPTVSDCLNRINATRLVGDYTKTAEALDDETCEKLLSDARLYNDSVRDNSPNIFSGGEPRDVFYRSCLNVNGDGIIGYITAERANINLPIYHGTSDDVLVKGAGHIEGSSFPIGGKGTHAYICGHRGLPSAKLFTDLDRLDTGDTFTITVLKDTLTYEVFKIETVYPDTFIDTGNIDNGDYVTLVTCTPYAVNTHRLLVHGKRIYPDSTTNAQTSSPENNSHWQLIILLIIIATILILVIWFVKRRHKKKKQKGLQNEKDS